MNLTLIAVLVGHLTITSYRSVPNQTDSSPFNTSTGERVSLGGAAISQDLLCGACRKLHKRCRHPEYDKKLHYGAVLFVERIGFKIINDCMGKHKRYRIKTAVGLKRVFKRQNEWLDIWVGAYEDERGFHRTFGISKHKVWLIQEKHIGKEAL